MSATVRTLPAALLVALACALAARPASAQVTAADSAAIVLATARTFDASDRWDIAEALYRHVVEHFGATPAAAAARARLGAPPSSITLGDGRVALQVWGTLYGAWLGVAIPGAFGADGSEPYGFGLLAGAPAGYVAGRSVARGSGVTQGQASAAWLGAWWGTWQGFGWQRVFEIGVRRACDPQFGYCYNAEESDEEAFAAMIIGGLAGISAATLLMGSDVTPAAGTLLNFGPLWGTWFGFAGGSLVGLEGDDLFAATLLAGNAGLAIAALSGPGWNASRNRIRMVSLAGVLGGLAGAGLDLLVKPNGKAALAIPLAGSVVGIGLGINATRDEARTDGGPDPLPSDALLSLTDGRWSVGAPVPHPRVVPGAGRSGLRLALGIPLLRATF